MYREKFLFFFRGGVCDLFQGEPHASPHTGFALLSVADGACLANATPAAALKKLVTWQVGFVAISVVPPKK